MMKLELELNLKLKLMLDIWWLISCCLLLKIDAHCLRESPRALETATEASSTHHMWQPQYPTGSLADTGSCNRPTTLRPATDSNVAIPQQNDNATTDSQTVASPVVTLANYVYQCAAKRESSLSKPSTTNSNNINLAMSNEIFPVEPLGHEQQMTMPAIFFQLAKHSELE